MRYCLILFWLTTFYLLHAQEVDPASILKIRAYQEQMLDSVKQISREIIGYKDDHFLFLNKNWQQSTVLTRDDKFLSFSGRFNVLSHALEAKLDEAVYKIYDSQIQTAIVGNRLLIPLPGTLIGEENVLIFFEVLSSGKLTLLQRFTLGSRMEGGDTPVALMTGDKVYFITTDLYFTQDFTKVEKLKRSKNKFLEMFGTQSGEIDRFIDENGLKLRKDEDVIQIFEQSNKG